MGVVMVDYLPQGYRDSFADLQSRASEYGYAARAYDGLAFAVAQLYSIPCNRNFWDYFSGFKALSTLDIPPVKLPEGKRNGYRELTEDQMLMVQRHVEACLYRSLSCFHDYSDFHDFVTSPERQKLLDSLAYDFWPASSKDKFEGSGLIIHASQYFASVFNSLEVLGREEAREFLEVDRDGANLTAQDKNALLDLWSISGCTETSYHQCDEYGHLPLFIIAADNRYADARRLLLDAYEFACQCDMFYLCDFEDGPKQVWDTYCRVIINARRHFSRRLLEVTGLVPVPDVPLPDIADLNLEVGDDRVWKIDRELDSAAADCSEQLKDILQEEATAHASHPEGIPFVPKQYPEDVRLLFDRVTPILDACDWPNRTFPKGGRTAFYGFDDPRGFCMQYIEQFPPEPHDPIRFKKISTAAREAGFTASTDFATALCTGADFVRPQPKEQPANPSIPASIESEQEASVQSSTIEFLSNVGSEAVGPILGDALDEGAKLSIISAYFTIFAFGELKDELMKLDSVRFLFSEPTFLKNLASAKEPREFDVERTKREQGVGGIGLELTLKNNLNQRALAHECAEWIRSKVEARSATKPGTVQPGGTYVVENPDGAMHAFMGATANFTQEGLGYERRPEVVTVVNHSTGEAAKPLKDMFDGVWDNPAMVQDVTDALAEQIGTLYRENAPEYVYFMTLYHLFRSYLEESGEQQEDVSGRLEDSVIWGKLYDFQKDAVVGAIRKLEKYKGCIIADSVGLGKTFEALAVIKYYQERNDRVLVLAPKRLRENWVQYTQNDERNLLVDDRLSYTVLNHTDLSRERGYSGDVNLETLRWGNYDLVVIDESHNFRNKPEERNRTKTNRYHRLMKDIVKSGRRTKVLLLSATPVNNRLLDLRNQIDIITEEKDDYLKKTDGIPSISNICRRAQIAFKDWNKTAGDDRSTQSFAHSVNADYFKLLDIFTIARSRKHIQKYYGGTNSFPERRKPISFHPSIDAYGELPHIGELNDQIAQLEFPQYQLLSYLLPSKREKYVNAYGDKFGHDFASEVNRAFGVANLMRVNLLKRMESSVVSFASTLQKVLDSARDLQQRIDRVEAYKADYSAEAVDAEEIFEDDESAAEEFMASGKTPIDLRDVDTLKLRPSLEHDLYILEHLLGYAEMVGPERDAKLAQLREFIANKVEHPFNPGNRKILVFSAFTSTVTYLFEMLAPELKERYGLECAMVTGAANNTFSLKLPRKSFETVLAHFSPRSKELRASESERGEIDILFATDCISEGQNLQDCDCLVNYDIHWNPVRIIQRFGRIDRLGSMNESIQLVNFWPDIELDEYIKLENRVKGRMALSDMSSSGEENLLEDKSNAEMNDLSYRRQQLETLKDQVLDLEDISGNISITDVALDDFRVEVETYVNEHPGVLDKAPLGIHAVAQIPEQLGCDVQPGVIFCLAQRDLRANPQDGNPTYPLYLLYVGEDGTALSSHVHPKEALDLMRACCLGKGSPDQALCDAFNKLTKDGTDMAVYTRLLKSAVSAISGEQEKKGLDSLFSPGEVGDGALSSFNDYRLVSMVVLDR